MKIKNYLILLIVLSILYLLQFTYFYYKYFSELSRLENEVKHNIDWVNSTLSTFGSQLDSVERRSFVNIHKIPLPVVFCGDTLDYSNQLIREKLEREFYSLLGEQGQIQLYLKRSAKYFPMIERHLDDANLPDDLKFLAVHESALIPNIRSRSNAVGLWQFMRQTGQLYKLKINRYIDERRDPEKATMAATCFCSTTALFSRPSTAFTATCAKTDCRRPGKCCRSVPHLPRSVISTKTATGFTTPTSR